MITKKKRVFMGAALTLGLFALSTAADARPEPIPKPVEKPEPGESPGTGQDAPEDPDDPPRIEPPEGLDCIEGDDQSDCDPDHEGDDHGRRPGNKPGDAWYRDMAEQMYNLQESLDDMADWGADHDPYVEYYAVWMRSVVQQYYALGYDKGKPRKYSHGRMTRGDFNYYYYYWVRPIYFTMLHYSAYYYKSHIRSSDVEIYREVLHEVVESYHGLVLCNYGFNGDDEDAREDLRAQLAEQAAGFGS
ncbi:MAG TPA: hypothetical protein VK034_22455 [Enhygromyxa sp.]|nr:hypothetical protein [Enhygromyxa sp.]